VTHSGGKPHAVGDRGQRYQVTYFDEAANKRKVCGWSDTAEGARSFVDGIIQHPGWSFAQIWDRTISSDPLIDPSTPTVPAGDRT
jgi:hypothetical protein